MPTPLQDQMTSPPQSRAYTPPHDPLEPIPHSNVHLYPYTFTSHAQIHSNHQHPTHTQEGGFQYFSTTTAVRNLLFFHAPPFTPNYREFPTRPPVLFIKVFPHPLLSPGLVMVSVKMMVRPPNFEREDPPKSQKDEYRNGTNFFTRT